MDSFIEVVIVVDQQLLPVVHAHHSKGASAWNLFTDMVSPYNKNREPSLQQALDIHFSSANI